MPCSDHQNGYPGRIIQANKSEGKGQIKGSHWFSKSEVGCKVNKPNNGCQIKNLEKQLRKGYEDNEFYLATWNVSSSFRT